MENYLPVKFIERALQRGETEEQIRRTLRMQGVSEENIAKAFNALKPNQQPQPQPQPEPKPEPAPEIQPQHQQQPPESRMQYIEPGNKKQFWLIGVIIFLVILGGAAAGYFYFDDLMDIIAPREEQPITEEPVISEEPIAEEPIVEEPIITNDQKKIIAIEQARTFLASHYSENSQYPETVQIDNEDAFYCYRKSGAHYILGTILEDIDNPNLVNDLDGKYYCGETTKDCTDPVYCVGP